MGEYRCNCGRVFSTPEERTMHAATCSAMKPADPLHQQAEALANALWKFAETGHVQGARDFDHFILVALQRVQAETREEKESLLSAACDMKVHASDERVTLEVLRWRVLQMTDVQIRILNPAWSERNPPPSVPERIARDE